MSRVYLDAPPIDWEDRQAEVSVANDATDTTVVTFRAKMGKELRLTGFGQAWDAAMDTFVNYSLRIDGVSHHKYHRLFVQTTAPETVGYSLIPVPILVPQGALIEVIANQAAGGATGNFSARITGEYRDYQGA